MGKTAGASALVHMQSAAYTDLDCCLKSSIKHIGVAGSTEQLIMLQVNSQLVTCQQCTELRFSYTQATPHSSKPP